VSGGPCSTARLRLPTTPTAAILDLLIVVGLPRAHAIRDRFAALPRNGQPHP